MSPNPSLWLLTDEVDDKKLWSIHSDVSIAIYITSFHNLFSDKFQHSI